MMPDTDVQQIMTIRSQTLALIAELTTQPKPSYQIDGQSVAWSDYLKQLQDTVAWCEQQIPDQTPVEIRSQGFS
jgi:hypothetical protein